MTVKTKLMIAAASSLLLATGATAQTKGDAPSAKPRAPAAKNGNPFPKPISSTPAGSPATKPATKPASKPSS